jgi:hypothetical protein
MESMADHGLDGLRSTERFGGFGVPGGALLGQGAGFVLGIPGFQGGLLRQLQRLHRGWRPTMITLKPARQFTLPVLDQHPSRRPTLVQRPVHTDDLPHRPLARIGVGPIREPHTQPVAEMLLQCGVVGLRRRHRGLEQHPSIDGQPAPVEGLHLVRNSDMGVQIRIPVPGVTVHKRRRDQAADVDLPDPVPSLPAEQCVAFDEGQRIVYGGLVRLFDLCRDVRVGDRPQARYRLDWGEGQVIAGDRLGAQTRVFSDVAVISRASIGSRPCWFRKNSLATSVCTCPRSVADTGSSASCPVASCRNAIRFAASTRKGLTSPA